MTICWRSTRYVQPNNIILGVSGDFDTASMEKRLRAAFESWPKGPAASKTAPADIHPAKPGFYSIHKDDVTQAYIYFVGAGTIRNTPDYYALGVLNEVFGGGFSGRLMNDIRTARGLAYAVGGGIGTDWDHPGLLRVSVGTKSSTTIEALNAARGEINDPSPNRSRFAWLTRRKRCSPPSSSAATKKSS